MGSGKLVMTILVRDEADIIRENLEFHLSHGVDFVVATDNGSVDGTREILGEYESRGLAHVIDEPTQDYSQATWVNRMTTIACDAHDADAVFHCDADEFWLAQDGDLHSEIFSTSAAVLYVPLLNVLLADGDGLETFPSDADYVVVDPLATGNWAQDMRTTNFYLFRYPPKVMFRTDQGALRVTMGNHSVDSPGVLAAESRQLVVLHYPVRGKAQFFRKIENGGASYARNTELDESAGWHWRWWYERLLDGTLDDEYRRLVVTACDAQGLIARGTIVELTAFASRFGTNGGLPGVEPASRPLAG